MLLSLKRNVRKLWNKHAFILADSVLSRSNRSDEKSTLNESIGLAAEVYEGSITDLPNPKAKKK